MPVEDRLKLPSKDADFAQLDGAHAYQTELGYRIASDAPSGRRGVEAAR